MLHTSAALAATVTKLTVDDIHCTNLDCVQSLGKPTPVGGFRFRTCAEVTCNERSALRSATLHSDAAWVCCACGGVAVAGAGVWSQGLDRKPEHLEDPWACAYCGKTNTQVPEIEDGDIDSTRGGVVHRGCAHCGQNNRMGVYVLVDVHSIQIEDWDTELG